MPQSENLFSRVLPEDDSPSVLPLWTPLAFQTAEGTIALGQGGRCLLLRPITEGGLKELSSDWLRLSHVLPRVA